MKRTLLFLTGLFITGTTTAMQLPSQLSSQDQEKLLNLVGKYYKSFAPPIFIINCTNADSQSSNANRSISASQSDAISNNANTTITHLRNEIVALFEQLQVTKTINKWKNSAGDTAAALRNRTTGFLEQTKELIFDHKCKLIAMGLAFGYGYLFWKFLEGNRYLDRTDLWSSWRHDLTLEELLEQPNEEIAQQLLLEVQQRFVNEKNPTDFLSPLVSFLRDIEQEMKKLKRYQMIYRWAKRLYLCSIFPANEKKFEAINKQIARLLYCKNAFTSWVAQYKLAQNKPEIVAQSQP